MMRVFRWGFFQNLKTEQSSMRHFSRFWLEALEARWTPAYSLPSLVSGVPGGASTANAGSSQPAARKLSSNGRFEVFQSNSTNLVAGIVDTNNGSDVFVRDLVLGTTTLVSSNLTGTGTASLPSDNAAISGNGRYVVFRSTAIDIVSNSTTGKSQVYRRDLLANTTVLVSVRSDGNDAGNADASEPTISNDGSRVAFVDLADNLVSLPTDSNHATDVFVRDFITNATIVCSLNATAAATGNGASTSAVVSDDGQSVAFISAANDLESDVIDTNSSSDVFVRNLATGTTIVATRGSISPGTTELGASKGTRSLSDNGRFFVFSTAASDTLAGISDNNGASDVFIRDLQTGTTQIVSQSAAGLATANGTSNAAAIGRDGRYVVYSSNATDLPNGASNGFFQIYRWDRLTGVTQLLSVGAGSGGNGDSTIPSISGDANRVAWESLASDLTTLPDTNGFPDVYCFDATTNLAKMASVNFSGLAAANRGGFAPLLCDDGSSVVFNSKSRNLVADGIDNNENGDLYLRNLNTDATTLISSEFDLASTLRLTSTKAGHSVSADGRYVVFTTQALSVVAGVIDLNQSKDVYLRDTISGTSTLVSHNIANGASGNGESDSAAISADGQFVAFRSSATDLVSPATTGTQIFRWDRLTGSIQLASMVNSSTAAGNGDSGNPSISLDGSKIVFESLANNFSTGIPDGNGTSDIYGRDFATGSTFAVSAAGVAAGMGNAASTAPLISEDGATVTFSSLATNLDANSVDANGAADIYRRNLAPSTTKLVSSQDSTAASGNATSTTGAFAVSSDGRYCVFATASNDLVAAGVDSNGASDVYLRDNFAQTTTLVSLNRLGTNAGNSASTNPAISVDGRYVVFVSAATDLVASPTATVGITQIYRWDRTTNGVEMVSINRLGTSGGNGNSSSPSVSNDGSIVAWTSDANDLVSINFDANNKSDVFCRNMAGATNSHVSKSRFVNSAANGYSSAPVVAGSGTVVCFDSFASDLTTAFDLNVNAADIYSWRMATAFNQLISARGTGQFAIGTGSGNYSIDGTGAHVLFGTIALGITANDTNNFNDVFVRDVASGIAQLVSFESTNTGAANNNSYVIGTISLNGRYVVFGSTATNIAAPDSSGFTDFFRRDLLTNTTILVSINATGTGGGNNQSDSDPSISADGDWIGFSSIASDLVSGVSDTNGKYDCFLRQVSTGITRMLSVKASGTAACNMGGVVAVISGDTSTVVFAGQGSDLVTGAVDHSGIGPGQYDLYSHSLSTATNQLVNWRSGGTRTAMGVPLGLSISADGRRVSFSSSSWNLSDFDAQTQQDIFAYDLPTDKTYLVSANLAGQSSNEYASQNATISKDGRYVAFMSLAGDLVANDTNFSDDVFRRDLLAQSTALVSVAWNTGNAAGGRAPVISADGRFVAFDSFSSSLVNGDVNSRQDVFVRDFATGVTMLVSKGIVQGNNVSNGPAISDDATTIVFSSSATNLVAGITDTNNAVDLFAVRQIDDLAPIIVGAYFDGTTWTAGFRAAAGNANYGYPAQSGAGQLTTMSWSTINTIYIRFSEDVNVNGANLGIRGLNLANYAISSFTYDNVNFVAKWVINGTFETDRVILDLDGDSVTAVVDLAGNKLAGSWTEGVSIFPTTGAAAQDFKYRFVVAVGDADRNGQVRNPDTNLVRANLFIDAGQGGYNIYADIDGNGLTRNADLNAVRSHLFVDPPSGPGPNRPGRSTEIRRANGNEKLSGFRFQAESSADPTRAATTSRRVAHLVSAHILDRIFDSLPLS